MIEEKNSTLERFSSLFLYLVGPLSHHDDSENYFYSQTRRDSKKALCFFSCLCFCVYSLKLSLVLFDVNDDDDDVYE